jgi:hypothetical protein
MSELAKRARAAMRAKAKSLFSEKDMKVDSSDWTPAEPLNADVKTGLRPVSRRAYKTGGKVEGEACAPRADRKPRKKSGGEVKSWVNAKVNRNVKDANEEREGLKHIGGMKKGGRAHKETGGLMDYSVTGAGTVTRDKPSSNVPTPPRRPPSLGPSQKTPPDYDTGSRTGAGAVTRDGEKRGGRMKRKDGGEVYYGPAGRHYGKKEATEAEQEREERHEEELSKPSRGKAEHYKKGGYAEGGKPEKWIQKAIKKPGALHKSLGVPMGEKIPAKKLAKAAEKGGKMGKRARLAQTLKGLHKADGGKAEKRPGKYWGGAMMGNMRPVMSPPTAQNSMGRPTGITPTAQGSMGRPTGITPLAQGSMGMPTGMMPLAQGSTGMPTGITPLAQNGPVGMPTPLAQNGPVGMPTPLAQNGPVGMPTPLAQNGPVGMPTGMARARGGRTKGKTNVNIVIAAGHRPPMMPPPGGVPAPGAGPAGIPVPVPPPGAPSPAMMGLPMQPPAPALGGGLPGGVPPMARKRGGKVYRSYKDMDAGAGSGEGRLEKTEIEKHKRGARRVGGKVYRSYKDMDAGAGSGEGRLEKTEIEKRKH